MPVFLCSKLFLFSTFSKKKDGDPNTEADTDQKRNIGIYSIALDLEICPNHNKRISKQQKHVNCPDLQMHNE